MAQNWTEYKRGNTKLASELQSPPQPLTLPAPRWTTIRHHVYSAGKLSPEEGTQSKDVLVVEDEAYLRDLIADVLEADGHAPRTAANGLEALQQIREKKPQLVLLDMMMPVMDGWEFLAAIKSNPLLSDLPIVIITAIYDIARTQQQTGARAVLTKPFDIDQIAEVVRHYAS